MCVKCVCVCEWERVCVWLLQQQHFRPRTGCLSRLRLHHVKEDDLFVEVKNSCTKVLVVAKLQKIDPNFRLLWRTLFFLPFAKKWWVIDRESEVVVTYSKAFFSSSSWMAEVFRVRTLNVDVFLWKFFLIKSNDHNNNNNNSSEWKIVFENKETSHFVAVCHIASRSSKDGRSAYFTVRI